MTGAAAKKAKLVDGFASLDEVVRKIKTKAKATQASIEHWPPPPKLLDLLQRSTQRIQGIDAQNVQGWLQQLLGLLLNVPTLSTQQQQWLQLWLTQNGQPLALMPYLLSIR